MTERLCLYNHTPVEPGPSSDLYPIIPHFSFLLKHSLPCAHSSDLSHGTVRRFLQVHRPICMLRIPVANTYRFIDLMTRHIPASFRAWVHDIPLCAFSAQDIAETFRCIPKRWPSMISAVSIELSNAPDNLGSSDQLVDLWIWTSTGRMHGNWYLIVTITTSGHW